MQTDIEIARSAHKQSIASIAEELGLGEDEFECYGRYKAKVDASQVISRCKDRQDGHLILVSAISPTPAGEGKTTTSVGLGDALRFCGKKVVVALREPSLGPVFGMKGGAAGGGYAQVVPMEDLNLHFTGDIHAVTAANNLLAALLDNHIFHGNALDIDVENVSWKRCMDMNDRQLRNIESGLGGAKSGVPRSDGFNITAASEIMAVFCMAGDMADLKDRLSRIVVGMTRYGNPVTAGDLKATGAMAALLRDAFRPNLVQTMEQTPVLVHGGPFANIAHGCNSVQATRLALKLGDYVVTEAGFGADLGAEKFMDLKCRMNGLEPKTVVIVATVRALKYHGGVDISQVGIPDAEAVRRGMPNLLKHIENMQTLFGRSVVVAINRFSADTEEEHNVIENGCAALGVRAVPCAVWGEGGKGGTALAEEVIRLCGMPSKPMTFTYPMETSLQEKIEAVVCRCYGGTGVLISQKAEDSIHQLTKWGLDHLPICIAKTQYSLSDDPALRGRPEGFILHVRDVQVSAGAGFIVVYSGAQLLMPGLPKVPSAFAIDVDDRGQIVGLF